MSKLVMNTGAGSSISAWIIMRGKKQVGKVQAHFGTSRVTVNVWDYTGDCDVQKSSASGYGYDKLTSALSGLTIAGIKLTDHCEGSIKATKNNSVTGLTFGHDAEDGYIARRTATVFKEGFKRKGYTSANWISNSKRVLNPDYDPDGEMSAENAPYKTITIEDGVSGYTSMHREAGLDILKAHGLTVIQAI